MSWGTVCERCGPVETGFRVRARPTLERGRLARLEALLAVHRPSLRGPERHGGFLAALRAGGGRLDALPHGLVQPRVALRLAVLAPLGLVLEVLVRVEQLLARCPDERLVAFDAHQILVTVLHGLSSEGSGS